MARKSVVTLELIVHEEEGTWIDWWLETDDEENPLPYDKKDCIPVLQNYDIILVGDKWFPGKDAEKAIEEAFRQYKKISILDDKDNLVAEIYDRATLYNCTEDLGRYRWQSQTNGNIERSFADVLECAEDGETYKHNWKGW